MAAHAFNPSTEAGDLCELENSFQDSQGDTGRPYFKTNTTTKSQNSVLSPKKEGWFSLFGGKRTKFSIYSIIIIINNCYCCCCCCYDPVSMNLAFTDWLSLLVRKV